MILHFARVNREAPSFPRHEHRPATRRSRLTSRLSATLGVRSTATTTAAEGERSVMETCAAAGGRIVEMALDRGCLAVDLENHVGGEQKC